MPKSRSSVAVFGRWKKAESAPFDERGPAETPGRACSPAEIARVLLPPWPETRSSRGGAPAQPLPPCSAFARSRRQIASNSSSELLLGLYLSLEDSTIHLSKSRRCHLMPCLPMPVTGWVSSTARSARPKRPTSTEVLRRSSGVSSSSLPFGSSLWYCIGRRSEHHSFTGLLLGEAISSTLVPGDMNTQLTPAAPCCSTTAWAFWKIAHSSLTVLFSSLLVTSLKPRAFARARPLSTIASKFSMRRSCMPVPGTRSTRSSEGATHGTPAHTSLARYSRRRSALCCSRCRTSSFRARKPQPMPPAWLPSSSPWS
mmetsp:Transcript_34604/g.98847  ORF Transcript_34604/g.98847 Transcript_34604/m.98847 type:complete len:313 (+) Transcript_34604:885-1823(+)